MALIEINKNPSPAQMRFMGILLGLFLGVFGLVIYLKSKSIYVAAGFWIFAVAVTIVYYAVPAWKKPIYLGWMYAVYPIGWVMSHVILAIVYYLVLTPIGFIMRCTGRDPMTRRFEPEADTYWVAHSPDKDPARYFRQF